MELTVRVCSIEGCGGKHEAKGFCARHYAQQPERRAYEKARLQDPVKREEHRSRVRSWNSRNKDRVRDYTRFYYSGFPRGLSDQLWVQQGGMCAICPRYLTATKVEGMRDMRYACADHEHNEQKTPRGLLCDACNKSLGSYEKFLRPAGLVIEPFEKYLNNPPARSLL